VVHKSEGHTEWRCRGENVEVVRSVYELGVLVPLAPRGVPYRPIGASAMLDRNLFTYGLGGMIAPFVGIKLVGLPGRAATAAVTAWPVPSSTSGRGCRGGGSTASSPQAAIPTSHSCARGQRS
jgi:hypothetical protein